MGRYMTQLKNQRHDADVHQVCQAMLAYFGGLKGFIEAWMDYYEEARRERSHRAIRCLQAMVRLIQCDATTRRPANPPTTAELESKYGELVKSLIPEDPMLVATTAREAGWRLTKV